jgi:hypothetical protein
VLGLFTRLGGLVGTFLPFNYFMMAGSYAHLTRFASLDTATMTLSFINLVLPTGLVAGFDGLLQGFMRRKKAGIR